MINFWYAWQVKIVKISQHPLSFGDLSNIHWFRISVILLLALLNLFKTLSGLLNRFLWYLWILRDDWRRSLLQMLFGFLPLVFIRLNAADSLLVYSQSGGLLLWRFPLRDLAYLTFYAFLAVHTWGPILLFFRFRFWFLNQFDCDRFGLRNFLRVIRFLPLRLRLQWFASPWIEFRFKLWKIILWNLLLLHLRVLLILLDPLLSRFIIHGCLSTHQSSIEHGIISQDHRFIQHIVVLNGILWTCCLRKLCICWLNHRTGVIDCYRYHLIWIHALSSAELLDPLGNWVRSLDLKVHILTIRTSHLVIWRLRQRMGTRMRVIWGARQMGLSVAPHMILKLIA